MFRWGIGYVKMLPPYLVFPFGGRTWRPRHIYARRGLIQVAFFDFWFVLRFTWWKRDSSIILIRVYFNSFCIRFGGGFLNEGIISICYILMDISAFLGLFFMPAGFPERLLIAGGCAQSPRRINSRWYLSISLRMAFSSGRFSMAPPPFVGGGRT